MQLFKFDRSGYEELLAMYPTFYREVYEMQEILKAEGKLQDDLKTDIQQVFFNQFIDYADSETISVYEKIIGIEPDINKSLDERRRVVRAFLTGSGKLSASIIKSIIGSYTEGDVECDLEKVNSKDDFHTLVIQAERGSGSTINLSDITGLIDKKIPAHLKYDLSFYENYELYLETVLEPYITEIPRCGVYFCGQNILF